MSIYVISPVAHVMPNTRERTVRASSTLARNVVAQGAGTATANDERISSNGHAGVRSFPPSVPFRGSTRNISGASPEWRSLPHHKSNADVWRALKDEAKSYVETEPVLASHLHSSIIGHNSLESSLAFILANKLSSPTLLATNVMQMILNAYAADPGLVDAAIADMQAVLDRDPACLGFVQILLFFKGFQAVQCHRIGHHLWQRDRCSLAHALQSRVSQAFDVDIHPAAQIGRGVMLDHATGIVIGETAVVGDNVSMLHRVTLGGSGAGKGYRHPVIGHGVLLGAGTTVLGPIHVGYSSRVGAGSLVVSDVPHKSVAVGVPARVIRQDRKLDPCKDMDSADFILDFMI